MSTHRRQDDSDDAVTESFHLHPQAAQAQPATSRRRRWPWIVGGILAMLVVIGSMSDPQPAETTTVAPVLAEAAAPAPLPDGTPVGTVDPALLADLKDGKLGGASSEAPKTAPKKVASAPGPRPSTYTYRVTGPKQAMITYSKADFQQSQETSAKVPWRKTVDKGDGFFSAASLVAQNSGSGTITCSITDDETGEVIADNSSEGAYAVVTCSG